MRTLREQLLAAKQTKGVTFRALLEMSGLRCSASSLQRKLGGKQTMSTKECEAVATALDATVAWSPDGPS